uniref:trypsin n=1 Tax=Hippocampus comes TaxID=109280 RepID=A0A3Q3DYW2_HIPCM
MFIDIYFALSFFLSFWEGIIGGREAAAHSRPYMASIQVAEGDGMKHECGGFVVADQWVMTAVHCLPTGANGRKVVLGVHSLSQAEDTKQIFDIMELHNHPQFNPDNYDNDITLIKLDRPFNASEAVKAVAFLRAGGVNPDTDAEVETAGWGSVDNLGSRPDTLKEAVIRVVSSNRCGRSDYFGRKFTDNMICGDSGGPLLYNGVVVGITSNGGKKCGQIKKPGIYTIISVMVWIPTSSTKTV